MEGRTGQMYIDSSILFIVMIIIKQHIISQHKQQLLVWLVFRSFHFYRFIKLFI